MSVMVRSKENWNENAAWAVLITNIGGRRRKDVPITVMADAVRFLADKYGSYEKVSREASNWNLRLSREMVRNFYDIARLDKVSRNRVDKNGIGIDVARRLYVIRDVQRRHETINAVSHQDAFTARHIIEYVRKSPNLSVEECKGKILSQKSDKIEVNALVIPLDKEEYEALRLIAREKGLDVTEVARRGILQLIESRET